jgi:tRNA U34 2-thiouridine synthase MnmA/TrmU
MFLCRCEPGKQLNVAVLLSGGVDSSLALRLLVAAGHKCKAFYLQIWFQVRCLSCKHLSRSTILQHQAAPFDKGAQLHEALASCLTQ